MAKIVFFCKVRKSLLSTVEFYKQDIQALEMLGHQVVICNRWREIPFNFNAIFIWWWTYASWPVFLARLLGKPSIITGTFNFRFPESLNDQDYFKRSSWQKILIRLSIHLCSLNLFVNRIEYESCRNYFALKNERYYPHIVNDDYLQGSGDEREIAILNISWSRKENLIRKGVPELLKAIRFLKDDGINVNVYLAGHKGDGEGFLREMVYQLGINDRVHLLGQISKDHKIDLLRKCEIYVQPSHYEGFGLAMAEAMGCGACVITCKTGAVEEVVGDYGIYVKPGNFEELAGAIKAVIFNDEMRLSYQRLAWERVRDCFRFNTKIELLRQYLKEVGVK